MRWLGRVGVSARAGWVVRVVRVVRVRRIKVSVRDRIEVRC